MLGNAFVIEVRDLLARDEVLQQRRIPHAQRTQLGTTARAAPEAGLETQRFSMYMGHMRIAIAVVLAVLIAAPLAAQHTPSVKEGAKEVGEAVKDGVKEGYDKTKDATLHGVGKALDKTGEGLGKAGRAVEGAGEDVEKKVEE